MPPLSPPRRGLLGSWMTNTVAASKTDSVAAEAAADRGPEALRNPARAGAAGSANNRRLPRCAGGRWTDSGRWLGFPLRPAGAFGSQTWPLRSGSNSLVKAGLGQRGLRSCAVTLLPPVVSGCQLLETEGNALATHHGNGEILRLRLLFPVGGWCAVVRRHPPAGQPVSGSRSTPILG